MRRKILFIILGLVIALVIHNFINDRRVELVDEIMRLQKKLIRTKIEDINNEKPSTQKKRLVEGPSTTVSLGRLQGLIGDMARASGIELHSVRPNPVIKYNYHEAVNLYLEATGGAEEVSAFLKRLSLTDRAIFISKVTISRNEKEEYSELRLTMEISGLRRYERF